MTSAACLPLKDLRLQVLLFPCQSPCGCRDLGVRSGSRIGPHHHRVMVEVHWRGVQGWRSISWLAATSFGSFNLLMAATGDVWIIPSSNLGLWAAYWAHFMCYHELWPTSVSHPFSFLNSSLGLAGGKYHQKIIIPIFRHVLQNFAILGYFPYILFYHYLSYVLSPGWFVIAVCVSISVRELVKSWSYCKLM